MSDYVKQVSDLSKKLQDIDVERKTLEKQKEGVETELKELSAKAKKDFGIEIDDLEKTIKEYETDIEGKIAIIQKELADGK